MEGNGTQAVICEPVQREQRVGFHNTGAERGSCAVFTQTLHSTNLHPPPPLRALPALPFPVGVFVTRLSGMPRTHSFPSQAFI